LPTLEQILHDPATVWTKVTLPGYDGQQREMEITSDTAVWFHMVIIILLLDSIVFMTITARHWLGIPLLVVMIAILAGYGVYAYRSYQGHVSEINRFMEEFTQNAAS
jgi:hypothetical protein